MVDLARERSFHLRWTVNLIRDLPLHGTNELHLYLENRFSFPSLPGSHPRGSLKPADAKILEREARRAGVVLVPHLNLLGHNENLLRRAKYRHLRCESDPGRAYQLNPLHAGTRPLLRKMIRDICNSFSSPLIHIGCDEAHEWALAEKQSGKKCWAIFADHVGWIRSELKRHGRRTAIWADMPLHHPRILKMLPKDIVLFDWCYAGHRAQSLRLFRKAGFNVVAATSPVGCFSFLPQTSSVSRQSDFLRDAFASGVSGHLATLWELMRGYHFSIEYAFSLPVQWSASGFTGTPASNWKRLYGKSGAAWWKAAEKLSRLQLDDGLLARRPAKAGAFNLDASQALTFATQPFAFALKYAHEVDRRKVRARQKQVEAWQKSVARLPFFAPRGPLRFFCDDLRLTADRMSWTLRQFQDWDQMKQALETRKNKDIQKILRRWMRDRAHLLAEYRRRAAREGYGLATVERLKEAFKNLKHAQKKASRACHGEDGFSDFALSLPGHGLEEYSIRRTVHPVDLT